MTRALFLAAVLGTTLTSAACAQDPAPLLIETKIALGQVSGRIDHLAVDIDRQRLYVAELGNDSVAVVDLKEHELLRTLQGFKEPQDIAYVPRTDTIFVANAGDGSLRIFNAADLVPVGQIALGEDADNIRVDETTNRVYVGHGDGAIAIIDPIKRQKIGDFPLKAHPESFQLERHGSRIFVNVPNAREIAVLDRRENKQEQGWAQKNLRENYPMALDEPNQRVWVAFRHPAMLGAFDMKDGRLTSSAETCGDADDVFIDRKRGRIYVTCGAGFVDTFEEHAAVLMRMGRLETAAGARTSLYVPELDRLFLAVRSTPNAAASLWVIRARE